MERRSSLENNLSLLKTVEEKLLVYFLHFCGLLDFNFASNRDCTRIRRNWTYYVNMLFYTIYFVSGFVLNFLLINYSNRLDFGFAVNLLAYDFDVMFIFLL